MKTYAKCILLTNDKMVLKFPDLHTEELSVSTFESICESRNIEIINITYEDLPHTDGKPCIDYFPDYSKLRTTTSEKSDKAYTKALVLGKIIDRPDKNRVNSYLVFTNKNNVVYGDVNADTALFVGTVPIYDRTGDTARTFGSNYIIRCNEAIIDNPCVMDNIIPQEISSLVVIANSYKIIHDFVDINTVHEIGYLYQVLYGFVDVVLNSAWKDVTSYASVEADFSKTGISLKDLEYKALDEIYKLMGSRYDPVDTQYGIRQAMCAFATGISLYKSLNCQSRRLEHELDALKLVIGAKCDKMAKTMLERYKNLKNTYYNFRLDSIKSIY